MERVNGKLVPQSREVIVRALDRLAKLETQLSADFKKVSAIGSKASRDEVKQVDRLLMRTRLEMKRLKML